MPRPGDPLLDAQSLAAAGAVIEREFRIADFARLAERLAGPEGMATARLALSRIEGVAVGDLRVEATAELTCQRCLAPLQRVLESASRLAFVASDEVPVPADLEAVACDPQRLDLAALVEDELLLALPLIARHAEGEVCTLPDAAASQAEEGGRSATRRPFAGLKELLKH
ncbi:MAG: DUF177 domain-containing protein [Steroidobacteraceae bacterium]|nr:DUF177 domain-containing protein [Steroidobacteraceae bacterium]